MISIFLTIISLFILKISNVVKNKEKEMSIKKSGISILWSIDGELNLDMLAGW
tara:strand:+ start:508 stop:666 length:159 start_codon:yes stop_codon:yes gene_type:complete